MKFIIFLLISASLLAPKFGKASTLSADFDESDKQAYETTKKLCDQDVKMGTFDQSEFFKTGFLNMAWPDDLSEMLKTSSKIEALFDSMGYWQALQDCYGDNETSKKYFGFSLITADLLGREAGFFVPGLGLKFAGVGIGKLVWSLSFVKNSKRITNGLNFVGKWSPKAIWVALTATIATQTGLALYGHHELQKQFDKDSKGTLSRALDENALATDLQALKEQIDRLQEIDRRIGSNADPIRQRKLLNLREETVNGIVAIIGIVNSENSK